MDYRVTVIMRGGDVQKSDFVRAFTVVTPGDFHGIASVTNIDEFNAFDDAAVIDIQAGNNAFG
jgi:hypothetical protein